MLFWIVIAVVLAGYAAVSWWLINTVTPESVLAITLIIGAMVGVLIGAAQMLGSAAGVPMGGFFAVWVYAGVLIGGALILLVIEILVQRHLARSPFDSGHRLEPLQPLPDRDAWTNATASDLVALRHNQR